MQTNGGGGGNNYGPQIDLTGRIIGFKVWEGDGGDVGNANPLRVNDNGPLRLSFITNECNCAATYYEPTFTPVDMAFQFSIDVNAVTQVVPEFTNYIN